MVGRLILVLCGLLAALPARAQDDAGAALLVAIEARDPAAVAAAFAMGARPDSPAARPPAFVLAEALAATPDEATRATVLAFAQAARDAGFAPETQIPAPMGNTGGSLATRLASVPGEQAVFLQVAALVAPERRCTLLGQLVFGRDGANFPAATALLPLIPAEQAAEPACGLVFTMLANPARRPPPTLVQAMLEAGVRPRADVLAELIRQLPAGEEGDAAFRGLAALDLGALATETRGGERRRTPVLAQLGEEVLERRPERAAPLLGRWAALIEGVPDEALCAALPGPAVRGWLSIPADARPEAAWMEALGETTRRLLLRCPVETFASALAEAPPDALWMRFLQLGEASVFRLMLAAGLRPADAPALAARLACLAEPRLLQAMIEAGAFEGGGLLAPYIGCLGGVEARRPGDIATLGLILAGEAADAPVAGDAPIAIATWIDRPDIAAVLADHGAAPATLPPGRQAFWRYRRLAALARTVGPALPWEPQPERVPAEPELVRLAPGLAGWLIHGECANGNCGYTVAVREGRAYRLVLEDAGYAFRLERPIGGRARDATVEARTDAALPKVTLWRYDGRVYRRFRCRETAADEDGATPPRAAEATCE